MSIIKQNSWAMGCVNPQLTEAQNNQMYYEAALEIDNMYISKLKTLKRIPAMRLLDNINTLLPNCEILGLAQATYGSDYLVMWYKNTSGTVVQYGLVSLIFHTDTETFTVVNDVTAATAFVVLDWVVIDNRIILCTDHTIFDYQYTLPAATFPTAFVFANMPTMDFGDWNYSTATFTVTTATNGATATVAVTGVALPANFHEWVGGMFYALGNDESAYLGQGKISAVSPTGFTVDVIHDFKASLVTKGTRVVVQKPVFFDDNEMPKVCGYFDSRLYFGNTKSKPMLVAGSKINLPYDFNVGKGLPAEAIVEVLNDTRSTYVKHIAGWKALFIFTDMNEQVVVPSIQNGITPSDFNLQILSSWGVGAASQISKSRPEIYKDTLVFRDKTLKRLIEITGSGNDFQTKDLTRGMDIPDEIEGYGIINDILLDTPILSFYIKGDLNTIRILNIDEEEGAGYTSLKFSYPVPNSAKWFFTFANPNKAIMVLRNKIVTFTQVGGITGLSDVVKVTTPSVTPPVDAYAYRVSDKVYKHMPASVATDIVGYDWYGYSMPVHIKSMPLSSGNTNSWDIKEVSALFVSYYKSARFYINSAPIAFGTLQNWVNPISLESSYDRVNIARTEDKHHYIDIISDEPYDINIQAYGWEIVENIII
jgi:hypothetical protein